MSCTHLSLVWEIVLVGLQAFIIEVWPPCSWPSAVLLSFLLYNNVEFALSFLLNYIDDQCRALLLYNQNSVKNIKVFKYLTQPVPYSFIT